MNAIISVHAYTALHTVIKYYQSKLKDIQLRFSVYINIEVAELQKSEESLSTICFIRSTYTMRYI